MANNILGWFKIIDVQIWNDRLHSNPYLSTICIMLVALCGSFMNEPINEYLKDSHIVGLILLCWSVTIAESIMTASKPLIGIGRSLLLSVIIFTSFLLGQELPPTVTQSIILTWVLASIVEIIFIGIKKIIKSSNTRTQVYTNEIEYTGDSKNKISIQTELIIFLALVYIIFVPFIDLASGHGDIDLSLIMFLFSYPENKAALILIIIGYIGWFIAILFGIYKNTILKNIGILLTIPIFFIFTTFSLWKDCKPGSGSYFLLAISLIALIVSFIPERIIISTKGQKDRISVQTGIIVFLTCIYIISMLFLDFADYKISYYNSIDFSYIIHIFSNNKDKSPLMLIILSYIGWFIAIISEIYNNLKLKRFGIILTLPIFFFWGITSLTKREFDLESGSYVLLAISLIALIISFIPEEKIDKAIKELK